MRYKRACNNEKIVMDKEFKDECRVLKIEPKLRNFFSQNNVAFLKIKQLLNS